VTAQIRTDYQQCWTSAYLGRWEELGSLCLGLSACHIMQVLPYMFASEAASQGTEKAHRTKP